MTSSLKLYCLKKAISKSVEVIQSSSDRFNMSHRRLAAHCRQTPFKLSEHQHFRAVTVAASVSAFVLLLNVQGLW